MIVSSTQNSAFSRPVNQSQSSRDRQENEENNTTNFEQKAQEKAVEQRATQDKLQQQNAESQRRLDGRIISFGYEENNQADKQQTQNSINRSRVNEAYSPPPSNESHNNQNNQASDNNEADAIDIIV